MHVRVGYNTNLQDTKNSYKTKLDKCYAKIIILIAK